MAIWLYSAANAYTGADATFRLAEDCGLVWRSFYADRHPATKIPRVNQLAEGDTLYLGFRIPGRKVQLLGRMRIGNPDVPLIESPVFCAVPAAFVQRFQAEGYVEDPILNQLVGIFVREVEPVDAVVNSIDRLTLAKLGGDPLDASTARSEKSTPNPILSQPSPVAFTFVPRITDGAMGSHLGIDVGGTLKGFHLCHIRYAAARIERIEFDSCKHPVALPDTTQLRRCVRHGDFATLATATYSAATEGAASLWRKVAALQPCGIYIDSPTGFSRNRLGHGRLTEKASYKGVWFQCTPSVCCGKEHGGDWNWLVYGMSAFMAVLHEGGDFTKEDWVSALTDGLYTRTRAVGSKIIRECFPTATVSVLRSKQRAPEALQLLHEHAGQDERVLTAIKYLNHGVFSVKGRATVFDHADSLIAALSSLPHSGGTLGSLFREVERLPTGSVNWSGTNRCDDSIEGRIAVVE